MIQINCLKERLPKGNDQSGMKKNSAIKVLMKFQPDMGYGIKS